MQVKIGPKYQVVIPKEIRQKIKGLQPGNKVSIHATGKDMLTIQTDPKSWLERTRGLMTEAWKDIDPIAQLEKGRNEWEERLKKLEKSAT